MQANEEKSWMKILRTRQEDAVSDRTVVDAMRSLNTKQRETLNDLLGSPDRIEQLLSSDTAKKILRELGKTPPETNS